VTEKEWFEKYYTPENKKIIDIIRLVKYGEMNIEISNRKPVNIYPSVKIRLQRDKTNATNFTELQVISEE